MEKEYYNVFLCHASEDKKDVVEPLANILTKKGLKVWYDKFVLKVGDSIRRSIDQGLANSRFGIVILSPSFFQKKWPQDELDGLAALGTKILPVWHKLTFDDVKKYSPILAGIYALETKRGIPHVAEELLKAITRRDPRQILNFIEKAVRYEKTLANFPEAFEPLVVIPGDVREDPPRCAQDLLYDTASTSDLAWIFKHKWHDDTILITDKFACRTELRSFLKEKNILVIGSPGVNILSRYVWKKGPFYFALDERNVEAAENVENELSDLDAKGLLKYKEGKSDYLKNLSFNLKGDLYDPFVGESRASVDAGTALGIVALCEHPFSDNHYAILVGGPRLLGTMGAEKMLLDKSMGGFNTRPFGGILKATESGPQPPLNYIKASVDWITREYSVAQLKEVLEIR